MSNHWAVDQIVEHLREAATWLRTDRLSRTQYTQWCRRQRDAGRQVPGPRTAERIFGSWGRACQAARLDTGRVGGTLRAGGPEQMLRTLRRAAASLRPGTPDQACSREEYTTWRQGLDRSSYRYDVPHARTLENITGSWVRTCRAAGLEIPADWVRAGHSFTDEECLRALQDAGAAAGYLTITEYTRWRARTDPNRPSANALALRFGGWPRAVHLAQQGIETPS